LLGGANLRVGTVNHQSYDITPSSPAQKIWDRIRDLRDHLDREAEERRKLTAILTGPRRPWWRPGFGEVALSTAMIRAF
jgi:hypothetical protein